MFPAENPTEMAQSQDYLRCIMSLIQAADGPLGDPAVPATHVTQLQFAQSPTATTSANLNPTLSHLANLAQKQSQPQTPVISIGTSPQTALPLPKPGTNPAIFQPTFAQNFTKHPTYPQMAAPLGVAPRHAKVSADTEALFRALTTMAAQPPVAALPTQPQLPFPQNHGFKAQLKQPPSTFVGVPFPQSAPRKQLTADELRQLGIDPTVAAALGLNIDALAALLPTTFANSPHLGGATYTLDSPSAAGADLNSLTNLQLAGFDLSGLGINIGFGGMPLGVGSTVTVAPCLHLPRWKRQRSKKGRAFFRCSTCAHSFAVETHQAQNFRVVVLSLPPPLDCAQLLEILASENQVDVRAHCQGPICDHVAFWKRVRSRNGFWFFLCGQCQCKWRVPTPSGAINRGSPAPAELNAMALLEEAELGYGYDDGEDMMVAATAVGLAPQFGPALDAGEGDDDLPLLANGPVYHAGWWFTVNQELDRVFGFY
eukprot:TRINITY_DN2921_c0_g1_i1.p1 TRINITY_DN2921_c0_g1~~TRINITY_DN2921_c0_g1_i1.p1  ORF type:complete len:492 (-),score=64.03 TRINITY_DN2921_c0_g1_i1:823-2274(-)